MVNISRDKDGKTRVAKGDKTGLGGQYAPDPQKLDAAKNKLEELNNTLFEYDEKVVYEIWYTTFTHDNGVLNYAPVFDNEIDAKAWVKEFLSGDDVSSEIKRVDIVASKRNPDGSFAGYVEPENTLPSVDVGKEPTVENCDMTFDEMITLVKKTWDDAKSDDGRAWSKSNTELKKAMARCPELYLEAVEKAQAEVKESYRKAGLI